MISAHYAVVGRAVCAASLLFIHAALAAGGLEAECQDIHSCKAALHASRRKGGAEGAALVQKRFSSKPAVEKPSLQTDDTAASAAAESFASDGHQEAAKKEHILLDGSAAAGHLQQSQQLHTSEKMDKKDKHPAFATKHEKQEDINGAHAVGYALVFMSVPAIVCLCVSLVNMQSFAQDKKEQAAARQAEHVEKFLPETVACRAKYSRTPSTPSLNSLPFSDASTATCGESLDHTSDSLCTSSSKERTPSTSSFSDHESDSRLPLVKSSLVPATPR